MVRSPRLAACVAVLTATAALAVPAVGLADTPPDVSFTWGQDGDVPLVGDVDADGLADLAQFRPSDGSWRILESSHGWSTADGDYLYMATWGQRGDVPLLGDLDGDGKDDLIVYRPSDGHWYATESGDGYPAAGSAGYAWGGAPSDVPTVSDVDHDGKADLVLTRGNDDAAGNSRWAALLSSNGYDGYHPKIVVLGHVGDRYLTSDLDGDAVADWITYGPSTNDWHVASSKAGLPFQRIYDPRIPQAHIDAHAYAPAIVKQDGVYHAFICSRPSNANYTDPQLLSTDSIRLTTSTDGTNWSAPKILVEPHVHYDPATRKADNYAYCDPSVVHYGGYWYLYNSNTFDGAADHSVYQTYVTVSRSESIDGPYLTYTQRGTWEDNPEDARAIVMPKHVSTSRPQGYGAGQQSLVVRNGKLQMWYVDDSLAPDDSFPCGPVWMMESTDPVSWDTAAAVRTNACAHSPEVKWDAVRQRYVMVWVKNPLQPGAELVARYSDDGVTWTDDQPVIDSADMPDYAHNGGFSSDARGWLVPGELPIVGWGAPYDLTTVDTGWALWGGRIDVVSGKAPDPIVTYPWGAGSADLPLVGDVDGDARGDLVVFRPADHTWNVAESSRGWTAAPPFTVATFGASGDVPFLGRADADGRADLIAYRPSDHVWRIAYASSAF